MYLDMDIIFSQIKNFQYLIYLIDSSKEGKSLEENKYK